MNEDFCHPLFDAITSGDLTAIEQLAVAGIDLNMRDGFGEPAFFRAVTMAEFSDDPDEYAKAVDIIGRMIELGADLHALDAEGGSILIGPIFASRPDLLAWLLELGVDPNRGCSEPWETVYDAARYDYYFEAFMRPSRPSLDPPDAECVDEDRFLAWVNREADRLGYLRPEIPLLLRRFGAMSGFEMAVKLGGSPEQPIRWGSTGWVLAK